MSSAVTRRAFLAGSGLAGLGLMLRYSPLQAAEVLGAAQPKYRRWEDLMRNKWTWDKVVRGTHGTNCAGTCAFNVFVKNGVVWREEQMGAYEASGDAPDYGPRGCQKGLRHSKYMYGKQRVLYPMKRAGARGEGKWERVSWDQACREIADKVLDVSLKHGPESISLGSGTQLAVKLASASALFRFANVLGCTVPEFYSGVGDLPTGSYMTLGTAYPGDTFAAVYKARCVLIWMANPAVTRIPDAHFFWEARYNGTNVVAIFPEFSASAMHASLWVNPRPGTDIALAMAMVHVILEEKLYDKDYVVEQTDLPLLVRTDNQKFLRETDFSLFATLAVRDNVFYVWDEATGRPVRSPGCGQSDPPVGRERRRRASLELHALRPALEGKWTIETRSGPVEVTTVFELLKKKAAEQRPELAHEITGVHPSVVRKVARDFARAKPALIYSGYAACKWLHGDILQRAMLLMLSLTGNVGKEGGGLQIANSPKAAGILGFAFADVGPVLRMVSATTWDYEHGRMKELNQQIYGKQFAEEFDRYYQESIREKWFPSYGPNGWKMAFMAGNGGAGWRAAAKRWRSEAFDKLETIVALTPDIGMSSFYADYVLPIAHHYERADLMLQSRIPYVQVLDAAVPPLGESVDDFTAFERIVRAVSERARARGVAAFQDNVEGRTVRRDPQRYHELYTLGGSVKSVKDVAQFIINSTPGIPKMSFDELAQKGIVRLEHGEGVSWDHADASFHSEIHRNVEEKRAWETLTGRQQYYFDHEWFLKFDEALPTHKPPLLIPGYPLQFMMGHARHGVHTMWRDDGFLLGLQRGEPDVYVNPDDARARGVRDGDMIRVFNPAGQMVAMAHVSAGIRPGMLFMYHGWDPMAFEGRDNFSSIISTAGLIKPTSMVGDYGHLGYRVLAFAPNQTYKDFSVEFEKWDGRTRTAEAAGDTGAAPGAAASPQSVVAPRSPTSREGRGA